MDTTIWVRETQKDAGSSRLENLLLFNGSANTELSENVGSSSAPAEIKPELQGRARVLFREGPRMGEKAELDY